MFLNFSDLPILINIDTGKRVMARDVAGLSEINAPEYRETYVVLQDGNPVALDPERIGNTPNLDLKASTTLNLKDGSLIKIKTAFTLLRENKNTVLNTPAK